MRKNLDIEPIIGTLFSDMPPEQLIQIRLAAHTIPGLSSVLRCHLDTIYHGISRAVALKRNRINQARRWHLYPYWFLAAAAAYLMYSLLILVPISFGARVKLFALNYLENFATTH